MNLAKSITKSALAACGPTPERPTVVRNLLQTDALREYGVELTPETITELEALDIRWLDTRSFRKLLDKPEGFTVVTKKDNEKHPDIVIRITLDGFFVQVGKDWQRTSSILKTLIMPLGISRLCFRFVYYTDLRTTDDRATVKVY